MASPLLKTGSRTADRKLTESAWGAALPLNGEANDYDALLEAVGNCDFVLLGEASHGTHEFYEQRREITRRLIVEKGFNAVAVEADWPDACRVNRYVRGQDGGGSARASLDGFKRFPTWMWRNEDALAFIGWLREYNREFPSAPAGFYGLDLYSMHASMAAVLEYLDKIDPAAARLARVRYSCFEHAGEDPQVYGMAASESGALSCQDEVVRQLADLQRDRGRYLQNGGREAADEFFFAEQNARLAKNAEEYYRSMFHGRVSSWNLRDQHMAETLGALVAHLQKTDGRAKVVLWAHNSHLGDARATQMGERGELNLGQLVRQEYGAKAISVGFSTFEGSVTAATEWDAPAQWMRVRPGMVGSYEEIFHQVEMPRFMLIFRSDRELTQTFWEPRLERAIGVIYRPDTERDSHYFSAWLSEQFDVVLHFDRTSAVRPLDPNSEWRWDGEVPETYPSGL